MPKPADYDREKLGQRMMVVIPILMHGERMRDSPGSHLHLAWDQIQAT
jgi:hypothetical protein